MRPDRNVPTVRTTARASNFDASLRNDTADALACELQVRDFLLEQRQVGLRLKRRADCLSIQRTIRLRTRRAHCRPFAHVERTELDAGAIRGARHRATERVDLSHQMSLADPADGRIAAHRAEGLDALRQQQGVRAHTRSRQRGFGAGVATADHDHVETARETHG